MPIHKNFINTSDFIIYIFILISFILEYIFPTELPINKYLSVIIGIIILVIAWIIIILSKLGFKKFNQKSGPGNETMGLITTGIFARSRNPIYLGVLFICPALGLIFNSLYPVLSVIPVFIFLKYLLIIPEEKYLLKKFGEEYSDYLQKVRRWV